jgi:hypothetical protein
MDHCKGKVFYDTEFQASVVAARREADWEKAMKVYPCGRHWHIASKYKEDRGKYPYKSFCVPCNVPLRPGRYQKHILTHGHKRCQEKYEKEKSPE